MYIPLPYTVYIQVSHLDLISFNALMSKFNMWMHMHEYLITCVHTISKIYTAFLNTLVYYISFEATQIEVGGY